MIAPLGPSFAPQGGLTPEAAGLLGFPPGTPVRGPARPALRQRGGAARGAGDFRPGRGGLETAVFAVAHSVGGMYHWAE